MNFYKSFILLLVITACSTPRASYDYDVNAQFDKLSSYDIYPDLKSRLSQLDEERFVSVLKSKLGAKGFSLNKTPDIFINFYSEEYITPSRNSIGIGVGGGGGNVGVGVSGGFPVGGSESNLRITIDMIDANNDSLIWQAVVESSFDKNTSPQNREAQLSSIIDKALKGYPPKR